jgi:DNA-binding CsgD family transcriptional regulator
MASLEPALHVRLDALLPTERAIVESIITSSMERTATAPAKLPEPTITPAAERVLTHPPYSLTARELDVLKLLFEDHTNKEAARRLGISPRTVEIHRAHILEKLRSKNAVAMTKLVMAILAATSATEEAA